MTNGCVDLTFTCGCADHAQCGAGKFCGWGKNRGKGMDKRGRSSPCLNDFECQSGNCRLGFCTKP